MPELTFEQRKANLVGQLKVSLAAKELVLELLHPNNPYSEEFMDERQIGARRAKIDMLKHSIVEVKKHLEMAEQL